MQIAAQNGAAEARAWCWLCCGRRPPAVSLVSVPYISQPRPNSSRSATYGTACVMNIAVKAACVVLDFAVGYFLVLGWNLRTIECDAVPHD